MAGFFEAFRKFATRGNILDLTIGFTVGAAFSTIARSLVDDIIMPFIAYLTGGFNWESRLIVLRESESGAVSAEMTAAQAKELGAVTVNYGVFLQNVMIFLVIALVMFLVIRLITRLDDLLEEELGIGEQEKVAQPADKKCPYCISTIPRKATRCPNCTSTLDVGVV